MGRPKGLSFSGQASASMAPMSTAGSSEGSFVSFRSVSRGFQSLSRALNWLSSFESCFSTELITSMSRDRVLFSFLKTGELTQMVDLVRCRPTIDTIGESARCKPAGADIFLLEGDVIRRLTG